MINKIAITVCLSFFCLLLSAQNELNFSISPIVSNIIYEDSSQKSEFREKGSLQLGLQSFVSYNFFSYKKLSLETGIMYSRLRYKFKINGLKLASDILNNTESELKAKVNYNLIEFPLIFQYKISKKNNSHFLRIGFKYAIKLRDTIKDEIILGNGQIDPIEDDVYSLKRTNWSIFSSYAYKFNLHNKIGFTIEPIIGIYLRKNQYLIFNSKKHRLVYAALNFRISK